EGITADSARRRQPCGAQNLVLRNSSASLRRPAAAGQAARDGATGQKVKGKVKRHHPGQACRKCALVFDVSLISAVDIVNCQIQVQTQCLGDSANCQY
uniref:Phorbol-ester/DAG-type domain-containing protein n=1 Tax=Macrostomum lignano TaxID=282301 RepID=A0A1I8F691_9PLAT